MIVFWIRVVYNGNLEQPHPCHTRNEIPRHLFAGFFGYCIYILTSIKNKERRELFKLVALLPQLFSLFVLLYFLHKNF